MLKTLCTQHKIKHLNDENMIAYRHMSFLNWKFKSYNSIKTQQKSKLNKIKLNNATEMSVRKKKTHTKINNRTNVD